MVVTAWAPTKLKRMLKFCKSMIFRKQNVLLPTWLMIMLMLNHVLKVITGGQSGRWGQLRNDGLFCSCFCTNLWIYQGFQLVPILHLHMEAPVHVKKKTHKHRWWSRSWVETSFLGELREVGDGGGVHTGCQESSKEMLTFYKWNTTDCRSFHTSTFMVPKAQNDIGVRTNPWAQVSELNPQGPWGLNLEDQLMLSYYLEGRSVE